MKNIFKFYFSNDYTKWEWICIKILLIKAWYKIISAQVGHFESVPLPVGICKILPCEYLNGSLTSELFMVLIIVLCILYLFENRMLLTTFLLFFVSLLFFTLEESNGVFERRGLITFLFFAQFIAYSLRYIQKSDFNLTKYRIQFSVQVIAIGYFLSGLSKLHTSGIAWIGDGVRMPLQILKSFYNNYADYGDTVYLEQGNAIAQFMDSNPILIYVTLTSALLLELGAVTVLFFSRRYMVVYGLMLYCMHLGILMVMNIKIVSIMKPMFIFFVNPLYLVLIVLYVAYQKFFLKRNQGEFVSLK